MKILVLTESAGATGGAEAVALTSARGLAGRGHHVTLLAGVGPDNLQEDSLRISSLKEAESALNTKREEIQSLWSRSARGFLATHLREGFDLIHLHSGIQRLGPSCYQLVAHSGVPLIYTHHDFGWACPMQGLYDYATASACQIPPGSLACLRHNCIGPGNMDYKVFRFVRHLGTHRLSGLSKAVTAHLFVSAQSRERILPFLPEGAHSELAPNPIDVGQEPPADIRRDSPFAYVGRLTPEKNPLPVAEICKQNGWPVTFVGDGPLKEQIRAINPDAELLGWLPKLDVQQVIRRSRCLIMPSLCYETQGMVALEAWAAGIPVITSSSYGIADEIIENGNGFVFESGDNKALRAKMTALENVEIARLMGSFAYKNFWQSPPTLAHHLDRLEAIYKKAIDHDSRTPKGFMNKAQAASLDVTLGGGEL